MSPVATDLNALPSPKSGLILLVDDFADAREMYAEYLAFRGYRVVTAASGACALKAASEERPAIILMDLEMRQMSGREAMRSLKADPRFEAERSQALYDGFDAVIPKPCLPDELVTLIQPFLASDRAASA
jgi:CheY-like chemotaxis protein